MTRSPARFTQADVARAVRAAKQAGGGDVELRKDGTIVVRVVPSGRENKVEAEEEVVF